MNLSIPKRRIECKSCKKVKHSTKFQWIEKCGIATLNSLQCKDCYSLDQKVVYAHRKNHPEPKSSKCECCGKVSKLQCDHSHTKSKSFRGYLCRKCNVGIGNLGDDVNGLIRAFKYLSKNLNSNQKTNLVKKLKTKLC
jgi:hypothetical protein